MSPQSNPHQQRQNGLHDTVDDAADDVASRLLAQHSLNELNYSNNSRGEGHGTERSGQAMPQREADAAGSQIAAAAEAQRRITA